MSCVLTWANAARVIPRTFRERCRVAAFGGIRLHPARNGVRGVLAVQGRDGLIRVARPAGFEPATVGLEVRCSVQLSYGRMAPGWTPGHSVWGLVPGLHIYTSLL